MNLKKTALITGASSGIGLELAKIMAKEGINLVLVARTETKLKDLALELKKDFAIEVYVLVKDLSQYKTAKEIFDWTRTENIQIDYLVNNAGFGDLSAFVDSNWEKQLQMINLNITTLTFLTHLFLPGMVKQKFGKIMNVSSTAAFQPGPLMSVYFATKAFILHFSEAIANELEGSGVTVTALCPGPTESGFMQAAGMNDSKLVKGRNLPTSKLVAEYGFREMTKGTKTAIHGTRNYMLAHANRLVPRNLALKITRFLLDKYGH